MVQTALPLNVCKYNTCVPTGNDQPTCAKRAAQPAHVDCTTTHRGQHNIPTLATSQQQINATYKLK